MKNTFIVLLLSSLLFTACNPYKDYDNLLQGEWACQKVRQSDTSTYLVQNTDKLFILSFDKSNNATLSIGRNVSDSSTSWTTMSFQYQRVNTMITFTGKNSNNQEVSATMFISVLNDEELIMTVGSMIVNGVSVNAGKSFVFESTLKAKKPSLASTKWTDNDAETDFPLIIFRENSFTILEEINPLLLRQTDGYYYQYGNILVLQEDNTLTPYRYEIWFISEEKEKLYFEKWEDNPNYEHSLIKKKKTMRKSYVCID